MRAGDRARLDHAIAYFRQSFRGGTDDLVLAKIGDTRKRRRIALAQTRVNVGRTVLMFDPSPPLACKIDLEHVPFQDVALNLSHPLQKYLFVFLFKRIHLYRAASIFGNTAQIGAQVFKKMRTGFLGKQVGLPFGTVDHDGRRDAGQGGQRECACLLFYCDGGFELVQQFIAEINEPAPVKGKPSLFLIG